MNLRELLALGMAVSGLSALLIRLQSGRRRLPVLAYHRVFDIKNEDDFPFDPELVSCSRAEFAWQMELVARNFTPITFAQLLAYRDTKTKLPKNPIIITFDDGHRDNFTHAFPVLKKLGIPATIFLSTGYIGAGDARLTNTFWFDRVCQLFYRAPQGLPPLDFASESFELGDVASRRIAAGRVQEMMKRVPDVRRHELMSELEDKLGSYPPPDDAELSAPLTWNEVRTMAQGGIEFGSHTVSHPVLLQLENDALVRELAESKQALERELNIEVPVLAYPVGKAHAYDDRVITTARAIGYRLGVSYVTGMNWLEILDEFSIRRLPVERYMSRAYFTMTLGLPERIVKRF